jgi:hypothetical protein
LKTHQDDLDQNNKPGKSWQQLKIKNLQRRDRFFQTKENKTHSRADGT